MAEPGPRGLSLIVFSGQFERVHYAFVLASAAAAIGQPATLFFSGDAIKALGRPAPDGVPGWHALNGQEAQPAAILDARHARLGVATFEELLAASREMGVRFIVCEMGLRAQGLTMADLRADLPLEGAGVVTLLTEAGGDRTLLFL